MKSKKGVMDVIKTIAAAAILGVIMLLILVGFRDTTTNASAKGAIDNASIGIGNIFLQIPLAGTVAGFVLVIAVAAGLFMFFGKKSGGFS